MSGYAPVFDSIATGTLYGRWPDIGLWAIVLSQADKSGVLDVTPAYLAGVTGLSLPEVVACMERFCQPDPGSRTKDYDGARLTLIDPDNRNWGWRVVNHGKYREKARLMSKSEREVASGANAARLREQSTAEDRRSPPVTAADRPSDADAESSKRRVQARGSRLPEDFRPDIDYAKQQIPDVDAIAEAQKFADYWRAKAGASGVKLDWQATWRNWIRNCRESGRYARRTASGSP